MKIAVIGATGLVGTQMIAELSQSALPLSEIILAASPKSVGQKLPFKGTEITVVSMEEALAKTPDIALFSAGGSVSLEWAPRFAEKGTTVIDNSSAWRMQQGVPLVVPEVNGSVLKSTDRIIANPNCSTIQMVMALYPLHKRYELKRVVVSTYQSVTGTGKKAVDQLLDERAGVAQPRKVYLHTIDKNLIPHIDSFLENGYTKEEMKMVNETRKILGNDAIGVTSTTVRVPVMGGHSEAVNAEFYQDFDLKEVNTLLQEMPGVVVQDSPNEGIYPMPLFAQGDRRVFVGRIRRDESQPNTLNLWVVADNLLKGAATNAVQIAEYLLSKGLLTK